MRNLIHSWNRALRVTGVCLLAMLVMVLGLDAALGQASEPTRDAPADAPAEGRVKVANLVYGGGKTSVCLADGFLVTVARETPINVQRTFERVELADEALFDHPFAIMTGEGDFALSADEKSQLKTYLQRGGFLLASAGCSNAAWAESFRSVIAELFGADALRGIEPDHPLFDQLYTIDGLKMKRPTGDERLWGLSLDGRLAMVFSPEGLNDTGNAGKGCCCCGGNEVRNARQINANILLYALTR